MTSPAITAPSLAPITVELMRVLALATGRPIGNTGAPAGATAPYGFISRIDTSWSGSMLSDYEMATVVYQMTCVALDPAGVEWIENRAQNALATPPTVPGWLFIDWEPLGSPGGVRPDRDVTPHLYFSTPQWRLIAQAD